jgi:cobalt-zinc-cadmium efflux system membrane fusion protein
MNNIFKLIIGALITAVLLNACGAKNADNDEHDHGTSEEKHGEEESTIATLTADQIKSVGITLGSLEQKQLTSTVRANGILRVPNNHKGNATALFGGVVKTLNVEFGDFVRKGQVIATIANPQFIQQQEEFLNINNQIILAEQELQRQQELNEGNAGAKRNLQNATSQLNTLRTRKSSLYEQIRLMGINPAEIANSSLKSVVSITSPITGTVSTVFAKIGSYVDVSSPIAEIVDNTSLHLDLQVFEKDLPKMTVGQTIHFTLTNNPTESYSAKVFNIGSSFENESKSISVHCNVIGNKKGLIDGMNVSAIVSLNDVTTTAVLNDAIVEADGKYYIFIQPDKEAGHSHGENDHHHEEGDNRDHSHEDGHTHKSGEKHDHDAENSKNFEKIEVIKGVSDMGYTAVTPVSDIPKDAKVVTNGAFFINAKMSNTGGHSH